MRVQKAVQMMFDEEVSLGTVSRVMHELGFSSHVTRSVFGNEDDVWKLWEATHFIVNVRKKIKEEYSLSRVVAMDVTSFCASW